MLENSGSDSLDRSHIAGGRGLKRVSIEHFMQVNVAFRCTAEVQVKIDRRHNERRLSHSAQSRRTAALVFGHRRQWAPCCR